MSKYSFTVTPKLTGIAPSSLSRIIADKTRAEYERDIVAAIDDGIAAAIAKGAVKGQFVGQWQLDREIGVRVQIARSSFVLPSRKKGSL